MTIYALSSGPGIAGVAVVRVSGKETAKVIKKITNNDLPSPRVATLRKMNNINTNELIDEGLIIWFPGPQSYTGEDLAEFHVHGSRAVVAALQASISNTTRPQWQLPLYVSMICLICQFIFSKSSPHLRPVEQ